ncbi:MAG: von Willebrand factor type A domain-containing protein [Candidatus Zixiibacteriota bacterium]
MSGQYRIVRWAVAIVLLISCTIATAAERAGQLEGRITNAESGEGIGGVTVTLLGTKQVTTSDSDGFFNFGNMPSATYSVRFSHADFETKELSAVTVFAGQKRQIDIALQPKDTEKHKLEKQPALTDEHANIDMLLPELKEGAGKSAQDTRSGIEQSIVRRDQVTGSTAAPKVNENYRDRGRYEPPIVVPQVVPSPYSLPYDMFFRDYGTNGFVETRRDRFSTFAVDVDDASYTLARRYLIEGNLPPQDAIRVEEFVNHFDYGYNPPDESRFRIFTEISSSPFDTRRSFLKIGIKGQEVSRRERAPLNLTIVIDVSGSMGYDNRLQLVKQSMQMLLNQLNGRDRVGVVAYGSEAFVVLQPTRADHCDLIMARINSLYPRGSTYAEAGLKLGYQMANRQFADSYTNMVILCSDGVANVGKTSPDAIMAEIRRFTQKGITLSTFGFGMGNYNDVLLEQLAKKGNGKYAYVDDYEQARTLFVEQLTGNIQMLGRDVKVQVEFDPGVVSAYRLIGYENRAVPDHKFRDNKQDGGEIGAGHEVTALYELQLTKRRASGAIGTIAVRWKDPGQTEVTEVSRDIESRGLNRDFQNARPEFRLAVVASRFAELLKGTPYSANNDYDDLLSMAADISSQLPNEQTRELVDLIGRARDLSGYHTEWEE